jgi:hypothetical protein
MEQLSPLWSVGAYAGVVLGAALVQRVRTQKTDLGGTVAALRIVVLAFSAATLVLLFSLPSTPVLSTFGYPGVGSAITAPGSLLHLLQDYNRAIVRTTEVLHWFLFLFVFGLVAPAGSILMPAARVHAIRNEGTAG